MHEDAPALLNWPARHRTHASDDTALAEELANPARHGMHWVWAALAYVPAPQTVHTAATDA